MLIALSTLARWSEAPNPTVNNSPLVRLVIGQKRSAGQREGEPSAVRRANYFRPFFADFFGLAFFEGVDFLAVGLAAPRLPANALSQPSAYFWFVPTLVIVTAHSSKHRDLPRVGRPTRRVWPEIHTLPMQL